MIEYYAIHFEPGYAEMYPTYEDYGFSYHEAEEIVNEYNQGEDDVQRSGS